MRPYLLKTHHKIRLGEVVQGGGPEFKPQYNNNKKIFVNLICKILLSESVMRKNSSK
jgi:hypothetical protein